MRLHWMKCQGDVWCKLNRVNLDHSHFDHMEGVYVIWHGGKVPKVVYVGQGNIRERLSHHRQNPEVQQYSNSDLFVTWASVQTEDRDGVETNLAGKWTPLAGDVHPNVNPVEVNSPW